MARREPSTRLPRGVVFTDLDGTLLDYASYDFSPALPALAALERAEVPLVLCSSKTRAEMLRVQERLGIAGPFIVENGGATLLSGGGPLAAIFPERVAGLPARIFGAPYGLLRQTLVTIRQAFELPVQGFGDVGPAEVAQWTDLDEESAALARQREFDEPFLWEPEPDDVTRERVRAWLSVRALRLTRGGRLWHLTGRNDKGAAVRWLLERLAHEWGEEPRSLGLGDGENDIAMLVAVDEGILVARPGGAHLEPRPAGLRLAPGVGPVGWRDAVLEWIERLEA